MENQFRERQSSQSKKKRSGQKALLLGALAVISAGVGAAAYTWHQATYVPADLQPATAALSGQLTSASDLISRKLAAAPLGPVQTITFSEAEVNQVVLGAIAQTPEVEGLLQATKGVSTSLENNRIESGLVVNLSEIPPGALPAQGQQALMQLTERFPVLADREVYVGIAGSPRIEAGQLLLDDNAVVRIGRFQLPLAEVVQLLGLTPADVNTYLAEALAQNGIALENIELQSGQIVITGSAQ